ncbi:hypothetical protein ACNFJ7_02140 [Sphingomonas sp. HT-1]|uniref:hypothetical protein n=2 Tax=Sphingomonas TaxID=13687 RepID=UPI000ADC7578
MRLEDAELFAMQMLHLHGDHAPGVIVDKLVAAIKAHNLDEAHFWDHVGDAVDLLKSGGFQQQPPADD